MRISFRIMLLTAAALMASALSAGTVTITDTQDGAVNRVCSYSTATFSSTGSLSLALDGSACLGFNSDDGGDSGGNDSGTGLVDPGFHNQNIAYSNARRDTSSQIDPDTGLRVFIVDEGDGVTYAPSCINNLNASQCSNRGLWNTGAKTNEVWAVRMKTTADFSYGFVGPRMIAVGLSQVYRPAKFDYVLASTPGATTSDFEAKGGGACEVKNTTGGSITVLSPEFERAATGCVIPQDTIVYMNIRATSPECDNTGTLCNSSFVAGSAFLP